MSLVNSDQLDDLAVDIYALVSTPITVEGKTKEEIEDATKARIKAHMQLICEYVVEYLEIKNVKAEEAYTAGVGTNTGAMNAPPYPVTGNVVAVQTNGGMGLVA